MFDQAGRRSARKTIPPRSSARKGRHGAIGQSRDASDIAGRSEADLRARQRLSDGVDPGRLSTGRSRSFRSWWPRIPTSSNAHLNYGFAYVDKIPAAGSITQVILANNALGEFTKSHRPEADLDRALYARQQLSVLAADLQRARSSASPISRRLKMQKAEPKRSYHVRVYVSLGDGYWKTGRIREGQGDLERRARAVPQQPGAEGAARDTGRRSEDAHGRVPRSRQAGGHEPAGTMDKSVKRALRLERGRRPSRPSASMTRAARRPASRRRSASGDREEGRRCRTCTTPAVFNGPTADVLRMFTSGGAVGRGRRLRQRRLRRPLRHRLRRRDDEPSVPQQRRPDVHRRHREGGRGRRQRSAAPSSPTRSGSTTTTTAGAICSSSRFGTPLLYHNEAQRHVQGRHGGLRAEQVRQHHRRDCVRLRQRRPARSALRQLLQAGEPARPEGPARPAERSRQRRQRRRRDALAERRARALRRTSPRRPGFGKHTGWTLDVGHGDFNNDGLQDIYLACDYGTDQLFFNNGDGTFTRRDRESRSASTRARG